MSIVMVVIVDTKKERNRKKKKNSVPTIVKECHFYFCISIHFLF